MDNVLAMLLGSPAKAKLLRHFLSNPDQQFTKEEIRKAARIRQEAVNKEIKGFLKMGLIREKSCTREVLSAKRKKLTKKKTKCYTVNPDFKYLNSFKQLIFQIDPATDKEVLALLKKTGSLRLVLLSGVFTHSEDAVVDLFIVADKVKTASLKKAIAEIEAHVGKELSYVELSQSEFEYRLSMYDKLVRDVLDGTYRIALDKLKSDWRDLKMSR